MPRDGRTLENLGVYDPASPKEELRLTLNVERARHWIDHGAIPSDTVRSIFKRQGVYATPEGATETDAAPAKRDRKGRRTATATKTRRLAEKAARTEAKAGRLAERVTAKNAAAQAAAEASEAPESAAE